MRAFNLPFLFYILVGTSLLVISPLKSQGQAQAKSQVKAKGQAQNLIPVDSKKGLVVKPHLTPAKKSKKNARNNFALIGSVRNAINNGDYLGARVLIKRFVNVPKTFGEWLQIRDLLIRHPSVGFDFLFKWEKVMPDRGTANVQKINERVEERIEAADQQMSAGQFEKAFDGYQKIAKQLRSEIAKGQRDNFFLYETVIHSMARALYGAGRFSDSLKVYNWISREYFRYKQVLFEKMWAAFRAQRLDLALGAVAAQHSSYFSDVIEPESYLIQIYSFKKLCRDGEVKKVVEIINSQREDILNDEKSEFFKRWARSDIEYISLQGLLDATLSPEYERNVVTTAERSREKAIIQKSLNAKYQSEKKRLIGQLDTVKAFSLLSIAIEKVKVNVDVVPDREKLMASGLEFWPVDDAEDWIDEIGGHLYIGESECEMTQPKGNK